MGGVFLGMEERRIMLASSEGGMPEDYILYMPFEDSPYDYYGMTYQFGPSADYSKYTTGKRGKCIYESNSVQSVASGTPAADAFNNLEYYIDFDIKQTRNTGGQYVDLVVSFYSGFTTKVSSINQIQTLNEDNSSYIYTIGLTVQDDVCQGVSCDTIDDNEWHHVVFQVSGGTCVSFLDGVNLGRIIGENNVFNAGLKQIDRMDIVVGEYTHLDNFRIGKGLAYPLTSDYTEDDIPPYIDEG